MKLATLKSDRCRDGELIVVSRNNQNAVRVQEIAPHLRYALENWNEVKDRLVDVYKHLNDSRIENSFPVNLDQLHSPLPRTFQWIDGSAFIHHIVLVRRARNAPLPETLKTSPLIYQGGGDTFLAPREDIPHLDAGYGMDFEGEVGVIVGDTPMGITAQKALDYIHLFVLINDVSLRGLVSDELAKGFGFFQSKPSSSLSPFAVTCEELGEAWCDGRIKLPLNIEYNGEFFGCANAGAMHFHFGELIAHAAKTRRLTAGTIIGSGTVSNEDISKGSSCLVERRMLEKLHEGVIKTPFMKPEDTIKMEMSRPSGENIFGTIFQKVIQY